MSINELPALARQTAPTARSLTPGLGEKDCPQVTPFGGVRNMGIHFGVPAIRILVFRGSVSGPPIYGNYHFLSKLAIAWLRLGSLYPRRGGSKGGTYFSSFSLQSATALRLAACFSRFAEPTSQSLGGLKRSRRHVNCQRFQGVAKVAVALRGCEEGSRQEVLGSGSFFKWKL